MHARQLSSASILPWSPTWRAQPCHQVLKTLRIKYYRQIGVQSLPAMTAVLVDDTPVGGTTGPQRTYAPTTEWDPQVQGYLEACLGVERLARISEALTRPPLATCIRVNTLLTTAQSLLERLPAALSAEDRALLEANPHKPYIHPQLPEVILVPGSGPHEIDYSCAGSKEVIVGRLAGEAIMRGAHLFVPGTLALSTGIARGDLVAVAVGVEVSGTNNNNSKWGMTRGTLLGVDPVRDAQLPDRSRLYIGVGRTELSRVEFFRNTSGLAVSMQQRVFRTVGCAGLLPGEMMLQNLPSFVAAKVLAPQPGMRVLDMCAAPGGKTTAIAQLMSNKGEVVALDRSHVKARGIRQLAEELGITCVQAYKMDATRAVLRRQPGEHSHDPQSSAAREAAAPTGSALQNGTCSSQPLSDLAAVDSVDPPRIAARAAQEAAEQDSCSRQPSSCEADAGSEGRISNGALNGLVQANQPSERLLQRIERKSKGRIARGLDPGIFAQLPEGKEPTVSGFEPESFDCVLLDAPCSALGLRPRLVHRQTMAELRGTASYQRKLLDAAVQLVKPGGTLVFSTCTINPGENEANVLYVLERYPFMKLVPQEPRLGGPGLAGKVALPDGSRLRLLSEEDAALVQRFDPAAPLDTIGFFVAKFQKVES